MKQFVNALSKKGKCFKHLCQQFPSLSEAKLKKGVFFGLNIRKLMNDGNYETKMDSKEKVEWVSFKFTLTRILGLYQAIVTEMLESFKNLVCNTSLQLHFLHSPLDYFPKNLDSISEKQDERYHRNIKEIEQRYQEGWNVNMIADYCWMLKRDNPQQS